MPKRQTTSNDSPQEAERAKPGEADSSDLRDRHIAKLPPKLQAAIRRRDANEDKFKKALLDNINSGVMPRF